MFSILSLVWSQESEAKVTQDAVRNAWITQIIIITEAGWDNVVTESIGT